jgi:DNA ligase-4
MNISVKEATVFSVFHPDAQDLFNICSDLKRVAWELSIPFSKLEEKVRVINPG